MKNIYLTSTLKSEWNKEFNLNLCKALENADVSVHLPQRDTKQDGTEYDKYEQNIAGMNNSTKILAVGENESINWGLEVGYAFGLKKDIILLIKKDHFIPVMSRGMYTKIIEVEDFEDIITYISALSEACLD